MALIDLKSDLSFYGKKSPGPYQPPVSRKDTKFTNDNDIPGVSITGYSPQGNSSIGFRQVAAGDGFAIDDVSFSDRGSASRKAQLGAGTKFPIGPTGTIHSFDKVRTGFTDTLKYDQVYGVKHGNSGLADTYTINSPIDDMYNKFNLRDDATPNSYIKHPLILRGIQRSDNSDPQRWGLNVGPGLSGAFDIPRGGIITAVNRTLIDVVRHAKFLASPKGIGFLAKQVGYQLMNPKAETRIYNPLSLGSLAPIVHINRHFGADGLLEGLISKLAPALGANAPAFHSRLFNQLNTPIDKDNKTKIPVGGAIPMLSSIIGGPGSLFGIGGTKITRYEDTSLRTQQDKLIGPGGGIAILQRFSFLGGSAGIFDQHRYSYSDPYVTKKGANQSGKSTGALSNSDLDEDDNSLKNRFEKPGIIINPDRGGTGDAGFDGGGISERKFGRASAGNGAIINEYQRMAYGDIPKRRDTPLGNKDSRQINHLDFRDSAQSQPFKIGWDGDKRRDAIDETLDQGLVKFSIGGIAFKAYLGSLNDAFAPGWNGQQDQGRADARYLYESFERTIGVDFYVPIYNENQRPEIWGKLQSLAQKTYPVYGSQGFHGQTVIVTIGDLYRSKEMIITDLSYDWDNETPWEITDGNQAPFYTNVSCQFTILGEKPTSGTQVYQNI